MAAKKTEDGIRDYLNSLGKTTKPVVDKEAVRSLKAEIRGTSDPIAKLRLMTALDEAEQGELPDNSGSEAVFIAEAKKWAESEGIKPEFMSALGVPDEVMKKAGFTVTARAAAPKRSGGTRQPALSLDEVKEAVATLPNGGWKLSQLAEALGRDTTTTRNYVNKLLAEKDPFIRQLGDDPSHDGRGRAPKLYDRT